MAIRCFGFGCLKFEHLLAKGNYLRTRKEGEGGGQLALIIKICLFVMDCRKLSMFLHVGPEQGLNIVHLVLLEQ